MLKNSNVVYFCHLKKLVRPETFGPYYVVVTFLSSIIILTPNGNFWIVLVLLPVGNIFNTEI